MLSVLNVYSLCYISYLGISTDRAFPADLDVVVKRIHKYLFHVLAHLYHAHYTLLRHFQLHAHLNTVFTHLMVFTSKFDLIPDRETDILLPLFSLLLKNLADPAQNPKLREGLGIGEDELSMFTSKTSSSGQEKSAGEKSPGEDQRSSSPAAMPSSSTTNLLSSAIPASAAKEISGVQTSLSVSSSPAHISKGVEGGHDSGVGEEDSISGISSTASNFSSSMPTASGTPESCRNVCAAGGNVSSLSSLSSTSSSQQPGTSVWAQPDSSRLTNIAAAGADGNGFLSSSFPPAQHHLFSQNQPPASLLSSSSPQRVSNGGSSLALHLPFSCDSRPAMMAHPGHVVDCTNQLAMTSSSSTTTARKSPLSAASPMFPNSSSPPHRTGLSSHQERVGGEGGTPRSGSPMVVDVDPTKPPSEWLSSMQVSAT